MQVGLEQSAPEKSRYPISFCVGAGDTSTPYSHSTHRDSVDPQKYQSAELGSTACPNLLLCLVWQVGLHSESSDMIGSTTCLKHFALFDVWQLGLFRLALKLTWLRARCWLVAGFDDMLCLSQ